MFSLGLCEMHDMVREVSRMTRPPTPVDREVLLVEDNPDDARLTSDALQESPASHRVSIVEDGVEAMAFLRREVKYAAAPRPDLIVLDLNLPKKNGREVLSEI